jgi:hypothetical protein
MGSDVDIFGMALVRAGEISKFFRWGLWEKLSWAGQARCEASFEPGGTLLFIAP